MADELIYILRIQSNPPSIDGTFLSFCGSACTICCQAAACASSKMSDYYIKETINFIEQNFQNDISIEDVAAVCGINGELIWSRISAPAQDILHRSFLFITE